MVLVKKNSYYKVLKFSLFATLVSLMSSMVYYSAPRGVVILFDEQGGATIKEQAEPVIPKKGEFANEGSSKEYFERRSEWLKNNRDQVNEFLYKKSRESAIYFSWVPWVFVAWLMRCMAIRYSFVVFSVPAIVTLLGWMSVNEFFVIVIAYVVGMLIVWLKNKWGQN